MDERGDLERKPMPGWFRALDASGKEIGRWRYGGASPGLLLRLRDMEGARLYCCCGCDAEMRISSDLRIYPAEQGARDKHFPGCPKREAPGAKTWSIERGESGRRIHVASASARAEDYMRRLNELTYGSLARANRLPDGWREFNRILHRYGAYVRTPDGRDLLTASVEEQGEAFETGTEYFAYGMLAGRPRAKEHGGARALFLEIEDASGKARRYCADPEAYEEQAARIYAGCRHVAVCGFAYKRSAKSKILVLSDFCVKPVDDMGVIDTPL